MDLGIDKVGPKQACNTPGPNDDEQADEAWGSYRDDEREWYDEQWEDWYDEPVRD